MSYDVVEAKSFWACVISMQKNDNYQAALMETMVELRQQPFRSPKLNTHAVGVADNNKKVFSSDVGGRGVDRRLIWQVFNKTIVVLLYGTHAVQRQALNLRVGFDPAKQLVTIYERSAEESTERTYAKKGSEVGRLFMTWTNAELEGFGFSSTVVANLRKIDTDDELLEYEKPLGPELFERVFNVAFGDRTGSVNSEEVPKPQAEEPAVTEADFEMERQLADEGASALFTRTEPAFLAEILKQPIEDWMVFLHPDQRGVVARNYSGPARVRGAAGTGKTVVGLHRAAHRAAKNRESGERHPILFTTFVKSLPPVFEELYLRLPGTRKDEVEFVNIDKLARRVCSRAGERPVTDPRKIAAAFAKAAKRVVRSGTPLGDSGFSRPYLSDEINQVIKGRGIASLDEYLEIARTGRRAPLGRAQRTQVWELMQEWDKELASRGTLAFQDVVLRALDHARHLEEPWYSSVIIDEAQDLTLVGLQFVRALVNAPDTVDRPNGLLLLGDGAQRVYVGGFKLRQAGIEVRGRTTVLRSNYRNTDEIIAAAQAVAGDAEVDDLSEKFQRKDEVGIALRSGPRPLLVEAVDVDTQIVEVAQRTKTYTADSRVALGDIGVLVPNNQLVARVLKGLSAHGVEAQDLKDYDGHPNDLVKVGTYLRGKGLEFKIVFLPGLSRGVVPRSLSTASAEETAEADELALAQLFVAMTRARDHLVALYSGEPSAFIVEKLDRFEVIPA